MYVNNAFKKTTKYARDEVLGRNCRFLQGPDTDPGARKQLREDIQGSASTKMKLLNYRKNGSKPGSSTAVAAGLCFIVSEVAP